MLNDILNGVKSRRQKYNDFDFAKWRGVNKLVSNTKINKEELADAVNMFLVEEGLPTKRWGTANFGNSKDSRGRGLFSFYKSDGTRELLRVSGTTLQEYNSSTGDWDDISGFTYTSDQNTQFVQIYDKVYICNGVDVLTYYDGSSINSFTSLTTPTGVTVTKQGTGTGTYTYSYRVTAGNDVGETLASASVTLGSMPEELDSTTYCRISWTAVSGATRYNIYGRTEDEEMWMVEVPAGTTQWDDKGVVTPSTYFGVPEANTTGGQVFSDIAVFKDTLFGIEANNPSRVSYSAGGDKINDFSVGAGGGFIDIRKNDGAKCTKLFSFQGSLIIFKENSIWQFDFTSDGYPSYSMILDGVGCMGNRAATKVLNDIFFASRDGLFVLGNEPNYTAILRTNELSARIRSDWESINQSRLEDIVVFYFKNKVFIAYSKGSSSYNNRVQVYDRERLGFLGESDLSVNSFVEWIDSSGDRYFLFADDNDGYVTDWNENYSDDKGSTIVWSFRTKQENIDNPFVYKDFDVVNFRFRNVSGKLKLKIWQDGTRLLTERTLSGQVYDISFGSSKYQFGSMQFGVSGGTGATEEDAQSILRYPFYRNESRSIGFEFEGEELNSNFILLNIHGRYRVYDTKVFPSTEYIRRR